MAWTSDRVDKLKTMWADGLSGGQIANRLGGVSRNAVIGKAFRLKLASRSTTSRVPMHRNQKRRLYPKRPAFQPPKLTPHQLLMQKLHMDAKANSEPLPAFIVPEAERKHLLDLENGDCRYPFGNGPFTFCGRPKVQGLSYCEGHARICLDLPKTAAYTAAFAKRQDAYHDRLAQRKLKAGAKTLENAE